MYNVTTHTMSQHVLQHLHDQHYNKYNLTCTCTMLQHVRVTLQQCYNIYKWCVMEQGWVAMATLRPHKLQVLHVHIWDEGLYTSTTRTHTKPSLRAMSSCKATCMQCSAAKKGLAYKATCAAGKDQQIISSAKYNTKESNWPKFPCLGRPK